jgi:sporulation protein YlmC with PRC-barrel domain
MDDQTGHDLITASRVNGTAVFNTDGERIGHIDDLSIDKISGQVVTALLSFGGFLGIGERYHPLPWEVLTYEPARRGFVISLNRTQLEAAPHYNRDELEAFGAGERESPLAQYAPNGSLPP